MQTRRQNRINDAVPLLASNPIVGGNANLLRARVNNVTMGLASPEGEDQSHHSFASDTPFQSVQVLQILFSNSSSDGLATGNPSAISFTSPTLHSQQLTSFGHTPVILENTPAISLPSIPTLVSVSTPAAT